jgi:sugar lactone lactonase YvrE
MGLFKHNMVIAATTLLMGGLLTPNVALAWDENDESVTEVVSFDPSLGQFPEGVTTDYFGNVFVTIAPTGELLKINPQGAVSTLATFDPGAGFLLGMTTDWYGNVYVALASFVPATHGLWRVSPEGVTDFVAPFPTDPGSFPNDIIGDWYGNLYITDSIGGAIYKYDTQDETLELWFQDPLLAGDIEVSPVPFPIGANGIAYDHDSLIVSNSQRSRLVRIEIEDECDDDDDDDEGGAADDVEVIVEDDLLFGADGIALDIFSNIYVAVNEQNTLLRVSPDGDIEVLRDAADGLDFPATIAFGRTPWTFTDLYITNFALFTGETANPALLKTNVGAPGWP